MLSSSRLRLVALAVIPVALLLLAVLTESATVAPTPPPAEQQQEEQEQQPSEEPPSTTCPVDTTKELALKLAARVALEEAKRRRAEGQPPKRLVGRNLLLEEGASLGIGISQPEAALHVEGTAKLKQLMVERGGGPAGEGTDNSEAAPCREVGHMHVAEGGRSASHLCHAWE